MKRLIAIHSILNLCGVVLLGWWTHSRLGTKGGADAGHPVTVGEADVIGIASPLVSQQTNGAGNAEMPRFTRDSGSGLLFDAQGKAWFEIPADWCRELFGILQPTIVGGTTLTDEVAANLFLTDTERRRVDSVLSGCIRKIRDLERSIAATSVDENGNTVVRVPPWGDNADTIIKVMEDEMASAIGWDRAMVLSVMLKDREWFNTRNCEMVYRVYEKDGNNKADVSRDGRRIQTLSPMEGGANRNSHLFMLEE